MKKPAAAVAGRKVITFNVAAVAAVADALHRLAKARPETAALVEHVRRQAFAPRRPNARIRRHLAPHSQAMTGPWRD